MKIIRFSSGLMLLLFAALFTLNSCEKDNAQPLTENGPQNIEDFAVNKTLRLTDDAGTTSVNYLIAADNQALLDGFTAEAFDLIAIPVGHTTKEVVDAYYADQTSVTEAPEQTGDDADDAASDVGMMIVDQDLAPGIAKVVITIKPSDDDLRGGWRYYTHYSSAGIDNHYSIRRHSWNRRVYFGLSYKTSFGANWGTIQSNYRKLRNNEEYTGSRTPSYQFRFRVKTKRNSAYSVEFTAQ